MTLDLPDATLRSLGEGAEDKVRLWAAVKGYELGELTAGEAAELAGLTKIAFLRKLGEFGVSVIESTPETLAIDLEVARRASRR